MSVMVNTYEILEVNTTAEESRTFIGHIVDYVEQFNKMKRLESLSGFKLTITADGKTATLECDSDSERDNTYVLTENGLVERSADHVIWSTEEIDEALCRLKVAKEVKIETTFSIIKLLDYSQHI